MAKKTALSALGLLIAGVCCLIPYAAQADVVYTYTGSDFLYVQSPYTAANHVSGNFTVANPLGSNFPYGSIAPEAYTFNDGVQTLDNNNSSINNFLVSTNSAGYILYWDISMSPTSSAFTDFILTSSSGNDQGYAALYNDQGGMYQSTAYGEATSGTWSGPSVAAPEPGTLFVLASGLLGLVGVRRGRRIGNRAA